MTDSRGLAWGLRTQLSTERYDLLMRHWEAHVSDAVKRPSLSYTAEINAPMNITTTTTAVNDRGVIC